MRSRREFLKHVASGTAGLVLARGLAGVGASAQRAGGPARRREVSVGGRRVKVVDVHGHCLIPEVQDVIKDGPLAGDLQEPARRRQPRPGTGSLAVHGRAGHRRSGDQHQCLLVRRRSRTGSPDRQDSEREAGGVVRGAAGSFRRAGVGRAPASRSGGRAVGRSRQEAGAARRRHRRQRRRRRTVGAQVRSVLGQGRRARHPAVHPPAAGAGHDPEPAAAGQGRPRQHHRQSAGDDRLLLPPDSGRHARPLPRTQDLRRARRRLPAVLQRPDGCHLRARLRRRLPRAQEDVPANTSRKSSSWTRWCSTKRGCGT